MTMNSEEKEKHLVKQLEKDEKVVKLVRLLARGIGPLLFLVLLISAISQGGIDRLINLTGTETISFVCIVTMLFGIIWTYQNEIAGGILIILAYLVMCMNMGSFIPGALFPIFLFTGILHIYAGLMEIGLKRRRRK